MCWWSLRLGLMIMGSSQLRWGVRETSFWEREWNTDILSEYLVWLLEDGDTSLKQDHIITKAWLLYTQHFIVCFVECAL